MTRIVAVSALFVVGGVLAFVFGLGASQLDQSRAEASGCTGDDFCISVEPGAPTEDDPVTVTVHLTFPNGCYNPHDWDHVVDGHSIDIEIRIRVWNGPCIDAIMDYHLPNEVGLLPAGAYEVTATRYDCPGDNGEITGPCELADVRHHTFDVDASPITGHCASLPPWPVPPGDSDCDGWTDEDEELIGTDPHSACGARAWPPDLNDDGVVNVSDIVFLMPPAFGRAEDDPDWNPGIDLNPDGVIDVRDIGRLLPPIFGSTCTP